MSTGDAQISLSLPVTVPVMHNDVFYTNGSLDWVGLTSKTISFSVDVLVRCAAAGVDPYSLLVGQVVGQNLPLGTRGRQNIQEAFSGLKSYGGLRTELWFGFGIKSFARAHGTTERGRSLVAICSALSECFHVEYSAQVFHNIVLLHKPPGQLTPAANEWLMIIRECSGVFSTTKFPVLAEGFMRLVDSTQRLTIMGANESDPLVYGRGCPKPEDLAESILGIGKVASGEYDSIAIVGCAAVGWLAAIAEWLYDLTVTIRDTEGNILYPKSIVAQEGQIQIMFRGTAPTEGSNKKIAVQAVSKTYLLPDSSNLVRARSDDVTFPVISGRLTWQSCLSSAFGTDFARLLGIRMNVGIAISCAARIFRAIGNAEAEVDHDALLHCRSYFGASSGQGFILNVLRWFPELEELRTQMDQETQMTFLDAKTQYEEQLAAIQRHCSCACCCKWQFDYDGERFCLVVMFETIILLCRILSGTNVADNLLPMRAGFEALYQNHLSVRRNPTVYDYETWEQVLGPIVYVIDTKDDETSPETMVDNVSDRRVVDTVRLFTGREIFLRWWETTALSVNGICAYLDILREFSLDSERVGLVNVVPGRIEKDHKPFYFVEDRLSELEHDKEPLLPFLSKSRFDSFSMLLTETTNGLRISFNMAEKSLQAGKTIPIGPGKLIQKVAEARGMVPCMHRDGNREINPEVAVDNVSYPLLEFVWRGITVYGIDCHDCHYDDHYLAVALVQAEYPCDCVLCEDECLQCGLSYALERKEKGEPRTGMILLRECSFLPTGNRRRICMPGTPIALQN